MKKRIIALLLIIIMILCGCAQNKEEKLSTTSKISRDEKFGAALLDLSPEDIDKLGFKLGDSCNILFSNGYFLEDVPYYNGYYVKNAKPVFVAYPGYSQVRVTINNIGIWEEAKLSEDMTVTITLNEAGKYLPIQESLGQIYSFERKDYETDIQFCNFRALSGGNLKKDFLYRGASPVDNSRGRASYTDSLLRENNIGFIIDLADSEDDIKSYKDKEDYSSDFFDSLYDNNNVICLDMGSSFQSDEYKKSVVKGLKAWLEKEQTTVYIHCMEGKDRTGFVCMLIEALAGASYEEMLADYMITYKNYYKVSKEESPEKYDAIAELYFVSFMEYLHGTSGATEGYVEDAKSYLKDGGMTENEIQSLISRITVAE